MKYMLLIPAILLLSIKAMGQWAVCDTMNIDYIADSIRFEDAWMVSYDSDIVVPLINNTGTHFAYPQAKLINITPLPLGMSLYTTNWNVFASAWNNGDTANARIGYYVNMSIPDNYTVKFKLYVTNFAPLPVDSCAFTDTITINLKPVGVTMVRGGAYMQNSLSFYPNPAQGIIEITTTSDDAIVDVLSLSGQLIFTFSAGTHTNKADISKLPAGMYLLRERGRTGMKKLVKTE